MKIDPEQILRASQHQGGTGNLGLAKLLETIEAERRSTLERHSLLMQTWEKLKAAN